MVWPEVKPVGCQILPCSHTAAIHDGSEPRGHPVRMAPRSFFPAPLLAHPLGPVVQQLRHIHPARSGHPARSVLRTNTLGHIPPCHRCNPFCNSVLLFYPFGPNPSILRTGKHLQHGNLVHEGPPQTCLKRPVHLLERREVLRRAPHRQHPLKRYRIEHPCRHPRGRWRLPGPHHGLESPTRARRFHHRCRKPPAHYEHPIHHPPTPNRRATRPNASTARSICSGVWAADSCTRIRAAP